MMPKKSHVPHIRHVICQSVGACGINQLVRNAAARYVLAYEKLEQNICLKQVDVS